MKRRPGSLIIPLAVLFSAFFLYGLLTHTQWPDMAGPFDKLLRALYIPDVNSIFFRPFFNTHPIFLFYATIILSIAIISVYRLVYLFKEKEPVPYPPGRSFVQTAVLVACLMFAIQMVGDFKFISYKLETYWGKTLEERRTLLFKNINAFALFCRARLPGVHKGSLLTDIDIKNNPNNMLEHRILAYLLFPLDIRSSVDQEDDFIIVYFKKNLSSIDMDQYTVHLYTKDLMILIRK